MRERRFDDVRIELVGNVLAVARKLCGVISSPPNSMRRSAASPLGCRNG